MSTDSTQSNPIDNTNMKQNKNPEFYQNRNHPKQSKSKLQNSEIFNPIRFLYLKNNLEFFDFTPIWFNPQNHGTQKIFSIPEIINPNQKKIIRKIKSQENSYPKVYPVNSSTPLRFFFRKSSEISIPDSFSLLHRKSFPKIRKFSS
jgi:hypothetical protein